MSITNELRESVKQTCWAMTSKAKWFAIADRIDIEHERKCKEQYACGAEHGIAASIEASMIQDHGYIALPKDANGEYIHIGDMMENLREDFEPPFHHTFRVYGIQYRAYGQECTLTEDGYPSIQYRASEVRHYHEPTVEDVLREFGDKYCDMVAGSDKESELFAEYAAMLQLKETE